jgi:hypothetical protein
MLIDVATCESNKDTWLITGFCRYLSRWLVYCELLLACFFEHASALTWRFMPYLLILKRYPDFGWHYSCTVLLALSCTPEIRRSDHLNDGLGGGKIVVIFTWTWSIATKSWTWSFLDAMMKHRISDGCAGEYSSIFLCLSSLPTVWQQRQSPNVEQSEAGWSIFFLVLTQKLSF